MLAWTAINFKFKFPRESMYMQIYVDVLNIYRSWNPLKKTKYMFLNPENKQKYYVLGLFCVLMLLCFWICCYTSKFAVIFLNFILFSWIYFFSGFAVVFPNLLSFFRIWYCFPEFTIFSLIYYCFFEYAVVFPNLSAIFPNLLLFFSWIC